MPPVLGPQALEAPPRQVARATASALVQATFAWIQEHGREISDTQLELARIPAPPFGEQRRAEWLRQRFVAAGLEDVRMDAVGNVLGMRRGASRSGQCIALSAHIDTVFPAGTSTEGVRRDGGRLYGPGISDNGAGVAALLGIASAMQATGLRTVRPLMFIGNVGEEGEGDLRGIRHIFEDASLRESIGAMLVVDGAGTDTLVTQALGSRRFEITVRGPGGHSWSDFGTPNPIVALAATIDAFSRTSLPSEPKSTFNVGVISGGTSVNSIPESASMRVDIRSASTQQMDALERALRNALRRAVDEANRGGAGDNTAGGLSAEVKSIGSRPAAELPADSRLLGVMRAVDAQLGIHSRVHLASTDANIPLALGFDALATGAGGSGGGAHTIHEWFDPAGQDVGLKRVLLAAITMAGLP